MPEKPDNTKAPETPTPPAPPAPPESARPREVKEGDRVNVVLASGALAEARVTKVRGGGKVDLSFAHNGESAVITSSPFGNQPDCWNFA